MTDDELAEIERVWASATPGPWAYKKDSVYGSDTKFPIAIVIDAEWGSGRDEDGVAIASAPAHVSALVAEVRRLRELLSADPTPTAEAAAVLLAGLCPACAGRVVRRTPHKHASISNDYFECCSCGGTHHIA